MTEFPSDLSIDLSRLVEVCKEEWRAFLLDVPVDPIPERQDLRAFLLNWVAVFVPEVFQFCSLQAEMAQWMEDFMAEAQSVWRFAKPPLIGSALFALTGEPYWLRAQREYFDYGGAQVRSFLHDSLALVAPKMSFDEELMRRLDHGMKVPYFFMDTPLVLFALSRGDLDDKMAFFRKCKDRFMNSREEETVNAFLEGEHVRNPLNSWMLANTSYVLLRLGCHVTARSGEMVLPLGVELATVWSRVQSHPLMEGTIKLTA